MTLDGANLTTEVFYKGGHDYRFLCHGKDQTGEGCRNYRVRFLCGRSGRCQAREKQKHFLPTSASHLVQERPESFPRLELQLGY